MTAMPVGWADPLGLFPMADQLGRAVALGALERADAALALDYAALDKGNRQRQARGLEPLSFGEFLDDVRGSSGLRVHLAWRLGDAIRDIEQRRAGCRREVWGATVRALGAMSSAELLAQAARISDAAGGLLWPHEQREIVAGELRLYLRQRGRR